MSDIYGITGVGLIDGQRRLESVSLNAAHASTPGYRRQVAASHSPSRGFESALAGNAAEPLARTERGVDLREGQLMATGRALDVAISGTEGFFGLSDGRTTWLTRAGSFRVDHNGLLIGEGGLRVQGTGGDVALGTGDVEIQADGRIVRDGVTVAVLNLFRPARGVPLTPGRGSLLVANGTIESVDTHISLRSGFVESSNAAANTEVLSLVALTRQVESLVRVTQGYDDALGRTIQRLGEI